MRIKDGFSEGEEPYNLVPLTDMVFNLLIFFLCATTFVQVEKDLAVQLPQTRSGLGGSPDTPRELVINIRQDGQTVVAGKVYDAKALANLISNAVQKQATRTVIIRADERGIMRYFAQVARTCKSAGVKEAKLVYLDERGNGSS